MLYHGDMTEDHDAGVSNGSAEDAPACSRITRLLDEAAGGRNGAVDELLPLVYQELHQLARGQMRHERAGHTLQPTALVNEAYLRLLGPESGKVAWGNRRHFYGAAAEAMRRILIEHARKRGAAKRGAGRPLLSLTGVADLVSDASESEILSLDSAIKRMEGVMPDAAAVVRLRFYAGLSVANVALVLEVSERTVIREWTYARAWLARELGEDVSPE